MRIEPVDVQAAYKLALKRSRCHYDRECYKNTPEGHFIGALGEYGAFRWAEKRGYRPAPYFLTDNGKCDIFLRHKSIRCEVKTWKDYQYLSMGRAISEKQFDRVKRKAEIGLWCSVFVPETFDGIKELLCLYQYGIEINVMGWNYISDLEQFAPVERWGYASRQVPLMSVREMMEL